MIKALILLFPLLWFSSTTIFAQVEISGTMDAGFSSGGKSSAFISNGIAQKYRKLHFSIPEVNLLLFAPINDAFFFEGRLQSDTWGNGTLRPPRFTLANITYADPDKRYSLSAGRFVTPFGFYPSRNLTIDRTFIDFPLSYSYYINMSDVYGYRPQARTEGNYSNEGGLMTSVYFGGYATGIRWDWEIQESELFLQTAVTTVSPGSARNYTNLSNAALISQLIYLPDIKWQLGFSASYGSFMQLQEDNEAIHQDHSLEQYRQSLVGFNVRYSLGFWEVIGETIYSSWKAPQHMDSSFTYEGNSLVEQNLSSIGTNLDIKFEPPFFTGSYIGLRLDHLNFLDEDPNANPTTTYGYETDDWDRDTFRISGAFGYKFARNVEAKILFSEQTPFDQTFYTFKAYLTAFF